MANQPNSYRELIKCAANYTSVPRPKKYDLLKYLGFDTTSSLSHTQVFYVIDYTNYKYLYIDPLFQKLLGYDKELLPDSGSNYFTRLWNSNDFKIFNEKIFPETFHFLKQHSVSDYPEFSFSFNYRVDAKDGVSHTLLQRATYFSDPEDGNPLAAAGSIVNITNYKTDSSIIHTVEKMNRNYSAVSSVPLFKSVYYPDKDDSVLTKRELEILAAIYEGMCSKQIADKFSVSINTVNNHRKNMLQKTNTNNASELIHYALNNRLL